MVCMELKRGINSTKSEVDGMAWQRCFQRWGDVSDWGEIIPMEQKRKIGMHLAGGNNPCGTKEQAGDESGRLK